jgi:hypothetical protein
MTFPILGPLAANYRLRKFRQTRFLGESCVDAVGINYLWNNHMVLLPPDAAVKLREIQTADGAAVAG